MWSCKTGFFYIYCSHCFTVLWRWNGYKAFETSEYNQFEINTRPSALHSNHSLSEKNFSCYNFESINSGTCDAHRRQLKWEENLPSWQFYNHMRKLQVFECAVCECEREASISLFKWKKIKLILNDEWNTDFYHLNLM